MSLTTQLALSMSATLVGTADLSSPSATPALALRKTLANGTGAGQADLVFADTRTLIASGSEDLDLAGGGLLSDLGASLTFAKVKLIMLLTDAGNGDKVSIGPGSATPFLGPFGDASDLISLGAGAAAVLYDDAGWAVGAGASDLLNLANLDAVNPATYSIIIIGTSA